MKLAFGDQQLHETTRSDNGVVLAAVERGLDNFASLSFDANQYPMVTAVFSSHRTAITLGRFLKPRP